ncbi:MAG: nucleotidyltransferase domain-containing protein [Phycisphaerae bacterium]|nr:nucleotidyltransferase domain-containing protein [Phycisphaerae bacterium]
MPVRSLNSSVLKWPDAQAVDAALRAWALNAAAQRPDVLRIGCIGSYARGDWGVGSDVDVVILLATCSLPFEQRSAEWDVTHLPVPADVLVYTEDEWDALAGRGALSRRMTEEAVWVYMRSAS